MTPSVGADTARVVVLAQQCGPRRERRGGRYNATTMSPTPDSSRSRMFDGLTDGERQHWLAAASARSLRKGHVLAQQGDAAQGLYLVETGLLKLVQTTADGQSLIVRFVGPCEPFGGIAAVEGARYPVTALAVDSMRLLAWSPDAVARLLVGFPQVRQNLMREMAAHMADALTRARELATERVGPRLAHTLLRLMRQCGQPTANGVLLGHALTRQEFAELAGTTLYTASRTLSRWEAAGILSSTKGRRLVIVAPERLESVALGAEG